MSNIIRSVVIVILVGLGILGFSYGFMGWSEPMLDEIIFEPSFEVTTNAFYKNEGDYLVVADNVNGKIEFRANPNQGKLNWKIRVVSETGETRETEENLIYVNKHYSLVADGVELFYGVNRVEVLAENKRGSIMKELTIEKLSLSAECAKAENAGLRVCEKSDKTEGKSEESPSESSSKSSDENTSEDSGEANSGEATEKCVHYEFGECWDKIEEQAYDDGYLDASDGLGHRRYSGCAGICADIYEDAYEEGYSDGEQGS